MTVSATDLPPVRRPGRVWLRRILCVCLLLPLLAAALVLDLSPGVTPAGPPDAMTAERARDVLGRLHTLVVTEARDGQLTATEPELDAALASLGRMLPGVIGKSRVTDAGVAVDLAVGAPLLPGPLWLNVQARVAPSAHGLRIDAARVGRLPLPPWLVQQALRLGLDRFLGPETAAVAMAAVSGVSVAPPQATLALDFQGDSGSRFFERLRARLRLAAGAPQDPRRVHVHLWWLERDARSGALPATGSALPWLRHAITSARTHAEVAPRDELKGALFALALTCGDPEFGAAIGARPPERMTGAGNPCAGATLGGRTDLRQHFVLSAAIYAVTTESAVLGVGELKELLDTTGGGSGFSFDDMAANLAGARFATAFLAAPPEQWPGMLDRIQSEADLLPSLAGLPSGLSAEAFAAGYGRLDSPEYAALIDEIERRIDALPLYRHLSAAVE